MKLQKIVLAEKLVTDNGQWSHGGRMPKSAFQLSKSKGRSYRLGSKYRWRIVRFNALDQEFRLLIAYHAYKEQYRAVLAIEHERDMSVLAQLEYHGTHPGWHVHAPCGDIYSVPKGVMRHPSILRLPGPRRYHRRTSFGILNDNSAFDVAAERFQLWRNDGLLI